jgi:hypothetical protein
VYGLSGTNERTNERKPSCVSYKSVKSKEEIWDFMRVGQTKPLSRCKLLLLHIVCYMSEKEGRREKVFFGGARPPDLYLKESTTGASPYAITFCYE